MAPGSYQQVNMTLILHLALYTVENKKIITDED